MNRKNITIGGKMFKKRLSSFLAFLAFFVVSTTVFVSLPQKSNAADMSQFNAGLIITDSNF
ncbi:MAG: hypothetical protein LBI63_02965, partial [Candidatus Ancillula sp.]|nr:hypothetical protein [Candidatus Ancillula sp.]